VRVFLITLAVSIFETIFLWSFGLAQKIWPAHPLLAITVIAGVSGIVIQALLSQDAHSGKSKSHPSAEN
jgi:hypothetical protein